ncbi:MAG: AraC family transcriptional regulator [Phycisphaerae bacterium]|nr:AraC family transcriptional regulator [Phycisphaerae bacterium]
MNKIIFKMNIIGPRCRERFLAGTPGGPLQQLGVRLAGISDLQGRYRIARRRPGFELLLGTLDGEARLTTLEGQRTLLPGDLLLAGPNSTYCYTLVPKKAWKIAWFHLVVSKRIPPDPAEVPRVLPCEMLAKLAQDMEELLWETRRVRPLQAEARYARELSLTVRIERLLQGDQHTPLPSAQVQCLETLFEKVRTEISHPWTLGELAERIGYSAGHLNRLSRQHFGRPALKQLHVIRMTAAAGLLRQSNQTLRVIARQVGYTDEFAFSVAFKRHFGLSPGKLRKG